MRNKPSRVQQFWLWLTATNIGNLTLALVVASLVVVALGFATGIYWGESNQWSGILVEAHGMLLDIVVIGLGLALLNMRSERQRDIKRYQEEIDDFRNWKADEAAHRLAGIVRRLNNLGVTKVELNKCYLRGVYLTRADLTGGVLADADLTGAYLGIANLTSSFSTDANLTEVNLGHANLTSAIFWHANFAGANLTRANLTRADLNGANLTKANLTEANLTEANFKGANLAGANLTGAVCTTGPLDHTTKLQLAYKLCTTASLVDAKMDPEVQQLVEQFCPHLLKKPDTPTTPST